MSDQVRGALNRAWNSGDPDDVDTPYADLDDPARAVRDVAARELVDDDLGAVRNVDLDDLEELYMPEAPCLIAGSPDNADHRVECCEAG